MKKYFALCALVLITSTAHSAPDSEYLSILEIHGGTILEVYRLPEGEDLSYWGTDRDTYFYKYKDSDLENKAPFWTKGFFNNDDRPDYLFIMFDRSTNDAFLIGLISNMENYKSVIVESSNKYMAVATRENEAGHFHLEGHGYGLLWNENEGRFDVIQ